MEKTAESRSLFNLFWGRMASYGPHRRLGALAFVIVGIIAVSFTQFGFWSIGIIAGKPVYLMLVLGPLVLGGLLFGPLEGGALGLFTGAVVFLHASFFPLDYYEIYFMTPLNTFGTFTITGLVSGLLFRRTLRGVPKGPKRVVAIFVTCFVLSFVATLLVQVNSAVIYGATENVGLLVSHLLNSPAGAIIQMLADAVFMFALCLAGDVVICTIASNESSRRLLVVFRGWMALVSAVVFMLASACIYTAATVQAQNMAEANMQSEVTYLARQLNLQQTPHYDAVLDGYEETVDGSVAIVGKDGKVLASINKQVFPEGRLFIEVLGYYPDANDREQVSQLFFDDILNGGNRITPIQAIDAQKQAGMAIDYLSATTFDDGYVAMIRPAEMVYETRASIMIAATLLALVLIASIAYLASRLLNQVVVQRIDETNQSLGRITEGDLNERVRVRDSREFASLSAGINTTVAALKESIAEAEQKNAQELLTAKAIQESAMPREFPPFPDIDRFDIYASMKTAKEVGGDFYDFFLIDDDKLGFLIADVSGKGIPAALFMMTAKTQIQTYMESGLPVNEAVDAANHQLCLGNDAGMFVTMFACLLNYQTGELTYVNAGHNPPLLHTGGTWEWMRDVSGMPLGLFDGIPYKKFTRQLETGEMLYLYTDGVTEAMDIDGNLFGEDRLEQTLYRYAGMNARSVSVGVRRAITDFTLDCEQSDDITMVAMKYGVPPERKAVMILPAYVEQLVHVHNFIREELHRRSAPKSVYNPLNLAAEELFVNICHYAYPDATADDPGEVRVGFEYEANPPSLTVTLTDDGIPYNPLEKQDAVTPDDIADVPIGGLGILMAKKSVDEMNYERVGSTNVLTFRKGW